MRRAFAVMPFDDSIALQLYEHSTKPVCKRLGLEIQRADEILSANPIIDDIIQAIKESAAVIVDISVKNPNVFYELGVSHLMKRGQTLVVTRDEYQDLPFDVRHLRVIRYEDTIAGKVEYESKLEKTLQTLLYDYRAVYSDTFDLIFDLLEEDHSTTLYLTLAVAKAHRVFQKGERYEVHGHNDVTRRRERAQGLSIGDELEAFVRFGFVQVTGGVLVLTEKGRAFADFLVERGYVCDYVNGSILTPGYDPSRPQEDYSVEDEEHRS